MIAQSTSTVNFGLPPAGGETASVSTARPDAEAWLPIAAVRARPAINVTSCLFYSHLLDLSELCSSKQPRGATTHMEKGKSRKWLHRYSTNMDKLTSMFSVPHSRIETDRDRGDAEDSSCLYWVTAGSIQRGPDSHIRDLNLSIHSEGLKCVCNTQPHSWMCVQISHTPEIPGTV